MPVSQKKLVKGSSKYFSRDICSSIYNDYVDSYLKIMRKKNYRVSTVLFISTGVKSEKPSVVPVEMEVFNDEALKGAAEVALEQSEGELDLILYAQIEDTSAIFGGRDANGNTIHRLYSISPESGYIRAKKKLPFFDVWVPPVGSKKIPFDRFKDTVLTKLATNYSLLNLH